VLKPANPKAKYCYERALEARERGLQAHSPAARDEFFESEARWLKLAESYEFSERLSRFLDKDFPKHPVCPTCAVPMWLVEMNSTDAGVEYHYECKVCSQSHLVAE
jgi:hypothetical protein